MNFPKYETYKESGVTWLGKIPSHWNLVPNRALMSERKEKVGKQASEYSLLSLTLNGVIPRDMENPQGKFPAEFDTYTVVSPEDLVFCLFDIDETPRAVGISRDHGMITGAYNVYSPTARILPKYLYYYYLSLDKTKELKPLYSGLRKTIQRGVFASIKSPLPPKNEQNDIVAFLDTKTAEIDALIAKKERQIQLLDEQKAIRINQAVTRGLTPDVTLKPSGIEWIGDIPEHWEVVKLKSSLLEVDHRTSSGSETLLSLRMKVGLVPHNEVSDIPITDQQLIGYKKVSAGEIVMNRMRAASGIFAISTRDGLVSPDYAVFKCFKYYDETFLLRLFKTQALMVEFRRYSKGLGTGESGFLRLYTDKFLSIYCPGPSIKEQQEIVKGIESLERKTAASSSAIGAQIQSLKTLRSTLIAHAVTGKIKV